MGVGRITKKRLTLVLTEAPLPHPLKEHMKPSKQLTTTKFLFYKWTKLSTYILMIYLDQSIHPVL